MLTELFPRMLRRYSSLPLLGPIVGDRNGHALFEFLEPVHDDDNVRFRRGLVPRRVFFGYIRVSQIA